jgi:uncharacterized membrane protein YphA (DoxX/SURF4 family)
MVQSRIIENLLAVVILFGLGWLFYQHNIQGNNNFDNFKEKMGKIVGGNKNDKSRFGRN